ncbi:hypothetical protein IU450_33070 [Nocardia abscessus]|uniref:hypothetical protein n=1 Tax=Nocardia abscessus TaxID=120957 RepID=UPI001894B3EB|nr:hypothetical protein [Nocardia abscessus]MBF6340689.1 hypothetical protein [Nocardia abscessus]
MTMNSTSATDTTWTGWVPVDDTALAVTDTGGPGVPVVYLNGHMATQQERIRASLHQVVERNPNIKIHAKVPSNHGNILRKDFRAVAEAVREVAPGRGER